MHTRPNLIELLSCDTSDSGPLAPSRGVALATNSTCGFGWFVCLLASFGSATSAKTPVRGSSATGGCVCAALSLPGPGRCVANANEIRASFGHAQCHSPHGLDRTPGSTDSARCIQCDEGASAVAVPKREGEHLDGPAHEEGEESEQVERDEHDDRSEAAARE